MIESGRFIFGPEVEAFEQEAAAFLGVPHAIGVANGTDATRPRARGARASARRRGRLPVVHVLRHRRGDRARGATPVFADIDPVTLNLDPEDVAARITRGRRRSCPCTSSAARRRSPTSPRSASRSSRTRRRRSASPGVARRGSASTFSFFPTKNLFALGDGGLVDGHDDELAERIRMLRFHGSRRQDGPSSTSGQLAPRRDPGGGAARLPRGWTAGRRYAVRPPRATRELGLGEVVEISRSTSPATSTTCSSSARPRGPDPRGARRGRDRACA